MSMTPRPRHPRLAVLAIAALLAAGAQAKLPPPTEEQKARAAEAAARSAENAKKEAAQLAAAQDRVAQHYASRAKGDGRPAGAPAGARQ